MSRFDLPTPLIDNPGPFDDMTSAMFWAGVILLVLALCGLVMARAGRK
jgi:hypothetical protein